jgi:hypothetical protein
MKKTGTLGVLFLFISSLFIHAQKDNNFYSRWHGSKFDFKRIQMADLKYSEKSKFYYYLSNDKENIYVNLRIDDNQIQRMILRSGLTVWVNMDGKKNRKQGIKYPVGNMSTRRSGGRDMEARQNPQSGQDAREKPGMSDRRGVPPGEKNMQMMPPNDIEVIGFSKSEPKHPSAIGKEGYNGFISFEKNGTMWYELAIRRSSLPLNKEKKGDKIKPMFLGIEYSGMSSNSQFRGPGQQGMGGSSSGGGGRRGGGGSSGRGSSGRGSMGGGASEGGTGAPPAVTETPVIFWIKNIQMASEN